MPTTHLEYLEEYLAPLDTNPHFEVRPGKLERSLDHGGFAIRGELVGKSLPITFEFTEQLFIPALNLPPSYGICWYGLTYDPLDRGILQQDNSLGVGRGATTFFHQYVNLVNGVFVPGNQPRQPAACAIGLPNVLAYICTTWIPQIEAYHRNAVLVLQQNEQGKRP